MSRELLEALDRRIRGLVQLPSGQHKRVRLERGALDALYLPAAARLIPAARAHGRVGNQVALDVVLAHDVAQVVVDLLLRRAQPRPVAALVVGERVQMAGHIAGAPGVAVVEPGPAQIRRAVEDPQLADPVPLELDRSGDAAEACTHDQHLWRLACGRAGRGPGSWHRALLLGRCRGPFSIMRER